MGTILHLNIFVGTTLTASEGNPLPIPRQHNTVKRAFRAMNCAVDAVNVVPTTSLLRRSEQAFPYHHALVQR